MSVLMEVRVQPRASKERIASLPGGGWKAYVYAAPVDGKANRAVAELLARSLGLSLSSVVLESGATSKRKRFRIARLTEGEVFSRLGATKS